MRMVRWCIRLTRLALVCEVIRYRLVQVRQNLKKKMSLVYLYRKKRDIKAARQKLVVAQLEREDEEWRQAVDLHLQEVSCCLFVVGCCLFVVYLLFVCCLFVIGCCLFVVYLLLVVAILLFICCWLLFVCCLLVVCSLLLFVCLLCSLSHCHWDMFSVLFGVCRILNLKKLVSVKHFPRDWDGTLDGTATGPMEEEFSILNRGSLAEVDFLRLEGKALHWWVQQHT